MASPAFAAGDLVPSNSYGYLVKGLTAYTAVAAGSTGMLLDRVFRWGGGSGTTVSDNSAEFNYKSNNNFSHVTNTGAKNNYIYNNSYSSTSKTTNNYQVLNTTNKTFYDITHNTYQTYNNITYNQQYNTYKIDYTYNNYNYNTYITNNNTYVSYYIVNNDKPDDDTYAEVYLVLPDGRSAYGLKATDVWGQYFNYNVSGAQRVAEDDGTTLGLWHLDGNFTNSAYNQTINPTFGSTDFRTIDDIWGQGLYVDMYSPLPDSESYTIEYRTFCPDGSYFRSPYYREYTVDTSGLLYKEDGIRWDVSSQQNVPVGSPVERPVYTDKDLTSKQATLRVYGSSLNLGGSRWDSIAITVSPDGAQLYVNGKKKNFSSPSENSFDVYFNRRYWKTNGGAVDRDEVYRKSLSAGVTNEGLVTGELKVTVGPLKFDQSRISIPFNGVLDELRISNKVLYTSDYVPALAPFDTNLVQVRPADPMDGDIVVYSDGVEISDHRIGGVRPTFPTPGFAWLDITDNYTCDSVQVYNGSSWVSSSADIYYQGSWYSVKDFDFEKCCYLQKTDSGGSGSGSGDSDGSGSGGGGSGGSGSGDTDISDSSLWNKLFGALASAVGAVFKGLLTVLATFAEGFASVVSTLTQLFTSLIGLGGEFSNFTGSFFSWLPAEIVGLLSLSITLGIVMAVIRFFWK